MKKEIAAMVINELKAKVKKEPIVTYEKEKDDENLYDLVRGGKPAMMVQRAGEKDDYIPRRKVIMMLSSESEGEYTPKRPKEISERKKIGHKKNQFSQSKKRS